VFNSSEKTKDLKQSGIRAASVECAKIGGINLGQGVCDLPVADLIKQAAYEAIETNKSLYSPCEGILELRQKISHKLVNFNHIKADPINNILVTHGSTGAFVCAVNTLFNPGDEVIFFEPFYGYHKNILALNNINIATVPLHFSDFSFDINDVKKAITSRTKGIVICTPCNPNGKVFSQAELLAVGKLAEQNNLYVITDEIYEYITYPGHEHISFASLENFAERTITISGFSKTYNMTGWRLGYAAGPAAIIAKMALVQDLLYVCPATPLQHAVLAAFELADNYYQLMREKYLAKRDLVVNTLRELGCELAVPQGAYYILADVKKLDFNDDEHAAATILAKAKVATVPGRSFYLNPQQGNHIIRICYALEEEKIALAMHQLQLAEF
jgi:aminotransferase